jgi:peptide subunit release factor 1 (eRF1)
MSGFKKMKDGVVVCTDEETIANQSGILTEVLKQLTVNLFKGLTITHISMPVKIFEPRTSLERLCDLFSFAPIYLKRAAQSQDRFERLKLSMTYAMSSIYLICG